MGFIKLLWFQVILEFIKDLDFQTLFTIEKISENFKIVHGFEKI